MKSSDSADMAPRAPEDEVGLGWLVAQPGLDLVPLHVVDGPDGPTRVSWVHAIELDDPSPWLRPGGLVLTTGLRLPRSRELQRVYVNGLVAAGAAGLGFGVGLRFASVPPGVVDACRELGLTLLQVPLETPFLAITQAVTDRISQQRRWQVQEVLDAQRSLTRAALKGGSPAVVRTLGRLLRSGVLLDDADRITIAVAGDTAGVVTETQPLGSPSIRAGRVTLVRDSSLTPNERLVLNHAMSLLSLDLVHLQRPPDEESGTLLAALLGPHGFDPRPVLDVAGFAADAPVTLIGLRATDPARTPGVTGQLRRTLPRPHLYGAAPEGGTDRFVLVPTEVAADAETALVRAADARAQSVTLVAGLPVLIDQVAAALPGVVRRLGEQRAQGVHVVRLAEIPADTLLPADAVSAVGTAAAPWLSRLAAYDEEHGSDLIATLVTFLTHHGRPDPAARALDVHRHTLRHRLARAERVAGFDLDDPRHRALLVLATDRQQAASTLAP